jgi:2-oxoglutarate ferredoxin oxidoreductase subunit gamma
MKTWADCGGGVRYEIRLAGEGGQGLILAGVILAEAASAIEGMSVAQTQSYGPEARGGASRSEVVLSDQEIDYPRVVQANVLLAMSQEAHDRFGGELKEDGLLLVDSILVHSVDRVSAYRVPITRLAEEATGDRVAANVVALGLIVGLTGVVSREAVEAALSRHVPKAAREGNLRAFEAGLSASCELKRETEHGN